MNLITEHITDISKHVSLKIGVGTFYIDTFTYGSNFPLLIYTAIE